MRSRDVSDGSLQPTKWSGSRVGDRKVSNRPPGGCVGGLALVKMDSRFWGVYLIAVYKIFCFAIIAIVF
ncbi:MAG: hypothetical protein LBQ66_03530 [Planctomycetaceae bacterium]|nr:hypothetical protein [Planctomycetaceae bacterium]